MVLIPQWFKLSRPCYSTGIRHREVGHSINRDLLFDAYGMVKCSVYTPVVIGVFLGLGLGGLII